MKKTRDYYKEQFDNQFPDNFELMPGEIIVQCKPPHPEYWFISNMARLFSTAHNEIHLMKPAYDPRGKYIDSTHSSKHRWCHRYLTIEVEGEDINVTSHPAYLHRLVAEYFLMDQFERDFPSYRFEDCDVHHIVPVYKFGENEPYECNRSSNLEILPKKEHQLISSIPNKVDKAEIAFNNMSKSYMNFIADAKAFLLYLYKGSMKDGVELIIDNKYVHFSEQEFKEAILRCLIDMGTGEKDESEKMDN